MQATIRNPRVRDLANTIARFPMTTAAIDAAAKLDDWVDAAPDEEARKRRAWVADRAVQEAAK